jgi:TonB family protein
MRAALGVILAFSLAFSVHAAEHGGAPPLQLPLDGETTNPSWISPPSGDDMAREYPPLAQLMQSEGGATIKCQVGIDGRLSGCQIVSEFPAGLGFGAAAVRTAAHFAIKPATLDGKPVVGSMTIPLRFKTERDEAQAPPAIPPPTSAGAIVIARHVLVLQGAAAKLRSRWRPTLEQLNARIVLEAQAQSGLAALDAFRQGLEDSLAEEMDRQAKLLASRMTEADLRATATYLETPAGKAWLAASDRSEDMAEQADYMKRLARAARSHLCAQTRCEAPKSGPNPSR